MSRSPSAAESTPSSETRRSSICSSALSWVTSWKRCSASSRAAPSTYSVSSAVSTSWVKAGASCSRNVRSVGEQRRVGEPRAQRAGAEVPPTSCSLRYAAAQSASPGSTGRSKVKTRFETPPVEVMITTIRTCGCSSRTSTWRIVVVAIGGAETMASRLVTCESVSVVTRIASSTSRRRERELHPRRRRRHAAARARAAGGRRSSGSPRPSARGRPRCADAPAGPAPPGPRARCGSSTARSDVGVGGQRLGADGLAGGRRSRRSPWRGGAPGGA